MIITIAIWIYITCMALPIGWAVMRLAEKVTGSRWRSLSMYWMLGLCFMTVYAEFFSLFYKVGALANFFMILAVGILLIAGRKKITLPRLRLTSKEAALLFLYFLVALAFAAVSCQKAVHADTDLYHAQAIHWIEEYGVVKGLGNLHNRLAYNSSFMCLQALLGGAFLLDQSTHVVNGYIACGVTIYVLNFLLRKGKDKKITGSGLLGLTALLFIGSSAGMLSAPNTDTFALLLVLFILIKWTALLEMKCEDTSCYAWLCVLGVMAVSVKLSTAMIILLVIKPAIRWIREGKIRKILLFLMLGAVVIAPYLIRNVILSGYLVYPYSVIDLFQVDWKMSPSVVDFDRKEIMAYGRGLNSYFLSDTPLTQWFPIWWSRQTLWMRGMVLANGVLGAAYVLRSIIAKNRKWDCHLVFFTAAVSFCFWLLSAPLPRYGMIFVFELPCVVLGEWLGKVRVSRIYMRIAWTVGVCLVFLPVLGKATQRRQEISLKRPSYYIYRECEQIEWRGINLYLGGENNYCGYYAFPSTPYEDILQFIEPRGETVKEGFRVREDARQVRFNNSGTRY